MKKIFKVFFCTVLTYIIFAILGYYLIILTSSNKHDLELEAAMTAAFGIGPIAAMIGFIVSLLRVK